MCLTMLSQTCTGTIPIILGAAKKLKGILTFHDLIMCSKSIILNIKTGKQKNYLKWCCTSCSNEFVMNYVKLPADKTLS